MLACVALTHSQLIPGLQVAPPPAAPPPAAHSSMDQQLPSPVQDAQRQLTMLCRAFPQLTAVDRERLVRLLPSRHLQFLLDGAFSLAEAWEVVDRLYAASLEEPAAAADEAAVAAVHDQELRHKRIYDNDEELVKGLQHTEAEASQQPADLYAGNICAAAPDPAKLSLFTQKGTAPAAETNWRWQASIASELPAARLRGCARDAAHSLR